MDSTWKLLFFFLFSIFTLSPISSYKQHPLDPLNPKELTLVQTIVKKLYPSPNNSFTFHYVGLDEPDEPIILSWLSKPTTITPHRRALVIARFKKQTHEIVIYLSKRSVISDEVYTGIGYPLLAYDEQTAAIELPLTYGPFIESAKKRGLDLSYVVCYTFTIRWFGEEMGKRVVKIQCFYTKDTVNLYLRPIQRIKIVVDLDEMKVVEYNDRFKVPIPGAEGIEYRFSEQKPSFWYNW